MSTKEAPLIPQMSSHMKEPKRNEFGVALAYEFWFQACKRLGKISCHHFPHAPAGGSPTISKQSSDETVVQLSTEGKCFMRQEGDGMA